MKVKVREFNQKGLQEFEEFIDLLKRNTVKSKWNQSLQDEIKNMLFDDNLTNELGENYEIEPEIKFENRYELGKYLYSIFKNKPVEKETGMLSWLALLFFEQICEKKGSKDRLKVLSKYRYIPEPDNSRRFYRHLILTPILLWQRLKKDALLLLTNPLYESGDAVNWLVSNQDFINNGNMISVAYKLYFNEENKKLKTGAVTESRPGSIQRLVRDIIPQLSMTYDLYATPVDQIMVLLPDEFDRWKFSQ